MAITGNDITVNNNGHMVVDGGTAGVVNGDRAILNNRGDAVITNGGTGVIVTGDNAVINNMGQSDIDGDNSVSVKVAGNATRIRMEGGSMSAVARMALMPPVIITKSATRATFRWWMRIPRACC